MEIAVLRPARNPVQQLIMAHKIWSELKRPILIWLIGTPVALGLAQVAKWSFFAYGKYYFHSLADHPRVYCYDLRRKVLNPATIGLTEGDTVFLRHFRDTSYHYVPSTESFSWSRPTIVIRHIGLDSMYAELVQFDTICYGWINGYLHRDALYGSPPSAELQKAHDLWAVEYKRRNPHLFRYKPDICSSRYGFWCDCH
jgi:hypothetical protein